MAKRKIGLKEVRSLGPGETIWDAAVAGFGARRQTGVSVAYVLFYRTDEGRQRWHTIGRHGSPWTPDSARAEAKRLLGGIMQGADPVSDKQARRNVCTVSELCDQYLIAAEAGRLLTRRSVPKKASTLLIDRGRIARHIKPLLGHYKITTVTREDVDTFMHDVANGRTATRVKSGKKRGLARVRGGKGAATRAVGLLGGIFSFAVSRRMRTDNPVHGVNRFADGKRERRLSDLEYQILGAALRTNLHSSWPSTISITRFLAFTGWRSGEALNLRWVNVDLTRRTAILPDTKTGRSVRPLPHLACEVLRSIGPQSEYVFPSSRGRGPLTGYPKIWKRILKSANMPQDVTPHTLRHSFASLASDLGFSDSTIGSMVGHKGRTTTSRYTHHADAVILAAADKVAEETAARMSEVVTPGVVVPLRKTSL